MTRLPKPIRQLIAVALALGVVALAYLGAVEPLVEAYQARETKLQETADLHDRYAAIAALEHRVGELSALSDAGRQSGETLAGDSDAIAIAGLQSSLQTIAGSNGASFVSAQPLPALSTDGLDMVGVRVDLFGTVPAIQQVLYKVETGLPLLFIERATLRRRDVPPEQAAYTEIGLDIQLDVYGAVWRETTEAAAP